MKQNYDYCLREVLKYEGGYSNHPADPGGPTNFGITLADYRRYIKANGTALDVKNMRLEDAKKIYKERYWDALSADNLPSGVDFCVFDYGVNSGIGRAARVYGKFKSLDPVHCINAICDERMAFLRSLRIFATFGKGWTARVSSVRTKSVQLAHQPAVSAPVATTAGAAVGGAVVAATYHWWDVLWTWLQNLLHIHY
jgi:lysozyme family protein